jgi:hypothetical protein
MDVSLEYLRQHYRSLSDDDLLATDWSSLVEAAQSCYNAEIARRKLSAPQEVELGGESFGAKPGWLEDAAEVLTWTVYPGSTLNPQAADARDALEAAGISSYLESRRIPPDEPSSFPSPTHEVRLLVPGNLNLEATSILERDIFNDAFVGTWQTHLEMLTDADLRAMNPKVVFCGLFDRIERVNRAYAEELDRRDLR